MASGYAEAVVRNRSSGPGAPGVSRQCFGLFAALREVDAAMRPEFQGRVVEAHPELGFRLMKGIPLETPKKSAPGRAERRALLLGQGFPPALLDAPRPRGVAADDLLDACALCWTAARVAAGCAIRLPADPPADGRGLRMEIWG